MLILMLTFVGNRIEHSIALANLMFGEILVGLGREDLSRDAKQAILGGNALRLFEMRV